MRSGSNQMGVRMKPCLIATLSLFAALSLSAQVVNDGASRTLNNTTSAIPGTVTIGTNGSFTLLTISDNALLTSTLHGVIGRNATASSNEVRLISPTARWQPGITLFVGSNGAFNRLVISNGAQVVGGFLGDTAILGRNAGSMSNLALVTGAGSLWSNANVLTIGHSGARNQLVVSNGARVHFGEQCYVGLIASSTNNLVAVSGAGSLWDSAGGIQLGLNSTGNRLTVRDGGAVRAGGAFIGVAGGFNLAEISGPGTSWTNASELQVGDATSGNQLTVSNGAVLFAGSLGLIGRLSSSSLNTATVTDPGSLWVNGGELHVGRDGPANRLNVNNGGWIVSSNASLGLATTASNNSVVITGLGSVWSNRNDLTLGSVSTGNSIEVRNGGHVFVNGSTSVGATSSGTRNTILISDPGSVWTNAGASFVLGGSGPRNGLGVINGARADLVLLNVGQTGASGSNSVLLSGPGSMANMRRLILGISGPGNLAVVNDGAVLQSTFAVIGSAGPNNEMLVTDDNSTWLSDTFVVGGSGAGNRLNITDGAEVRAAVFGVDSGQLGIIVGDDTSSTNNRVTVDGGTLRALHPSRSVNFDIRRGTNVFDAGLVDVDQLILTNTLGFFEFNGGTLITRGASIFNNNPFTVGRASGTPALWEVRGPGDHVIGDGLTVGSGGSFAQLIHTNGVLLTNDGPGVIGGSLGSRSNNATIGGAGTRWWMSDGVVVGASGSDNRLIVRDGASLVTASHSYLGLSAVSSNNELTVTGPASSWNTGAPYGLRVGEQGRNNRLSISQGARVSSADGELGSTPTGSNNLALITDPDSSWVNQEVRIGREGPNNQLVINNGGFLLTSRLAFLGGASNALRNSAIVTGPSSAWAVGSNLFVGSNGGLCQLVISNGAAVSSGGGAVGVAATSSNNLVVVTGPGSMWSNGAFLEVGRNGAGNRLSASDGAQVLSQSTVLGQGTASSDNVVQFRSPGTLCTNSDSVAVGVAGSRNRLTVEQGARLESRFGFLGGSVAGSSNELVVAGPDSLWQVGLDIAVGLSGNGNRLVLTNGGRLNCAGLTIGSGNSSSNNEVLVTGLGSFWTNSGPLQLGQFGRGNRLMIRDGAEVDQDLEVTVGVNSDSLNNRLTVEGGSLRLLGEHPLLDIRRGTNVLNAGLIETGNLLLTNSLGSFEFNGGTLLTRFAMVSNTRPFVVGASGTTPALWSMIGTGAHVFGSSLNIGGAAANARLLVTNGAAITSVEGILGTFSAFNHVLISGAGSRWDAIGDFAVGLAGSSNSLVVSNGGQMTLDFPLIGTEASSSNNHVLLTGSGSRWIVRNELLVGATGPANQMTIADNALMTVSNTLILGATPATSRNNRLHIPNGELFVRNAAATGTLDIRHGTNRLDAGLVDVDRLRVTNSAGTFELNGGTLSTLAATIANGRPFSVGNGVSDALFLSRGGTNSFANNLVIASNGLLQAYGEITGTLIVSAGGRFMPGAPFDPLNFTGSVILQGRTDMVIRKNGTNLLNNLVTATGGITYGGDLVVTKLGADALGSGDRFRLFGAAALAGSFSSIVLPPLPPGLSWTNQLLVDGSIEITGVAQPGFSGVGRTGTNLVFSGTNGTPGAKYAILTATNVTLPASNWLSVATNQFGAAGEFSFTNGILFEEPERYFRLRTP